jgi:HEAT repeat protein
MLDQALSALKTLDWGADLKPLKPIDEAINSSHGDASARKDLETKLAALLSTDVSRSAKDFICRKLMIIGTAASVPALAALLVDKSLSHMARFALERIPGDEAAKALRDALAMANGEQKIGVITSLGARRDDANVKALSGLLGEADGKVAAAAAHALGAIRSAAAAQALAQAKTTGDDARQAVSDASLACAEELLSLGKKAEATAIYKRFTGEDQPRHVRVAATRGMLAVAGKPEP